MLVRASRGQLRSDKHDVASQPIYCNPLYKRPLIAFSYSASYRAPAERESPSNPHHSKADNTVRWRNPTPYETRIPRTPSHKDLSLRHRHYVLVKVFQSLLGCIDLNRADGGRDQVELTSLYLASPISVLYLPFHA